MNMRSVDLPVIQSEGRFDRRHQGRDGSALGENAVTSGWRVERGAGLLWFQNLSPYSWYGE